MRNQGVSHRHKFHMFSCCYRPPHKCSVTFHSTYICVTSAQFSGSIYMQLNFRMIPLAFYFTCASMPYVSIALIQLLICLCCVFAAHAFVTPGIRALHVWKPRIRRPTDLRGFCPHAPQAGIRFNVQVLRCEICSSSDNSYTNRDCKSD